MAVVLAVLVAAGATVFLVARSEPDYRTTFLVDASVTDPADFSALRTSLAGVAANVGDGEALALRRFGGTCGDKADTRQVVGSGTGNRRRIGRAVRELAPHGQATLNDGILAAIHDFSGHYPFRGRKENRIVVVTSHGADACATDPARLRAAIKARARAAGVSLRFRFVGYKIPDRDQAALRQTAAAGGDSAPAFAQSPQDLTVTLKKFTAPTPGSAGKVDLPPQIVTAKACTTKAPIAERPSPAPSAVRLPRQVTLPTGAQVYGVGIYGTPQYLIGPAGLSCDNVILGLSARMNAVVGREGGPGVMASYYVSSFGVRMGIACSAFAKDAPELKKIGGFPECARVYDDAHKTIPTTTPNFHVATGGAPPSANRISATLTTLRVADGDADPRGITCTLPRAQADICTAALTYFFILQSTGTSIPSADIDRVSAAIGTYVHSLR
ncbi:hypothetical protein [Actinomadura sp. DC4]|uniref:hypothetical protein n=1 Tax=Actinomadura sp. DC4 TaxID=3055069 RepID=UPI0025AF05FA|nr:hypothetical protein [Actinomadura sp. DC4]MDN3355636.1 hypothetical protein [Actinomadura sp. DC4]